MYRPPNSKENSFTQEINEIINKIKTEKKELTCSIDHNMDLSKQF